MRSRVLLIVLGVAGVLAAAALARKETAPTGWPDDTDARQLKFSHKFHVKEAGIACEDCHAAAKASTGAADNLRATHDNCTGCHQEQVENTCAYCHKQPDNIQPAVIPPPSVIFAHAKHVALKNVQCATCHPGLDAVDYAGPKNMPAMETCTSCHNDVKATNACEACHVSLVNLVPPDHLRPDFRREHRQMTRLGALEASCATCHTQNFCADCHGAGSLLQFGKSGLMADPSPRGSPSDRPQQMMVTLAHPLNYRFTHGIDAKGKAAECATCHSTQEFCAECHAAGDNIRGMARPVWHLGAGFTTVGVGSGGGRHAEVGRRDIESCAGCHDVRGGDPTCMTCHVDGDGIRGTDPRTHPGGYMRDTEEGSWHTDPGATCYACHTDLNARPGGVKGRNFCGYCHGS